jgi:hypothetical protein
MRLEEELMAEIHYKSTRQWRGIRKELIDQGTRKKPR